MKLTDDVMSVLNTLGINDPRIQPALEEYWKDEEYVVWMTTDVVERIVQKYGVTLNEDQAREILRDTVDRHLRDTTEECFDETYMELYGLPEVEV